MPLVIFVGCIYTHTCYCVCVCIYIYMCVCIYIYIYIYIKYMHQIGPSNRLKSFVLCLEESDVIFIT